MMDCKRIIKGQEATKLLFERVLVDFGGSKKFLREILYFILQFVFIVGKV
jgi:hypothetical protein